MGTPRSNVGLGDVVATRTLRTPGGESVLIRFGKPRRTGRDWFCPYAIGRSPRSLRVAYGIDAVQALYNALEAVRITLEKSGPTGKCIGGHNETDHGFQRVIPRFFGLDFAKRLSDLVDAEIDEFGRQLEARGRKPR